MRFSYIPYSQVIAQVKMDLSIENTTDHDPYLLLMADEAMRNIDDLSMYELRTETVPLDSGTSPIPCGLMRVMAVWYTNEDGTRCTPSPYVHRDIVNYCECDVSSCGSLGTGFQINGSNIVFHNPEAMSADSVSVAFIGTRLDENNQPLIAQDHDRAVRAYLRWRWYAKHSTQQDNMGKAQLFIQLSKDAQREFAAQKPHLQGRAQVIAFQENKRQITNKFNAWIHPRSF